MARNVFNTPALFGTRMRNLPPALNAGEILAEALARRSLYFRLRRARGGTPVFHSARRDLEHDHVFDDPGGRKRSDRSVRNGNRPVDSTGRGPSSCLSRLPKRHLSSALRRFEAGPRLSTRSAIHRARGHRPARFPHARLKNKRARRAFELHAPAIPQSVHVERN